jgi:hypothetical protein
LFRGCQINSNSTGTVPLAVSIKSGKFTTADRDALFGGGSVRFAFAALDGDVGTAFYIASFAWWAYFLRRCGGL